MKKTIIIRTNWDRKKKKGGWAATVAETGKTISGTEYNTSSDQLSLTAMTEATKAFGGSGIMLKFANKNSRAIMAVKHPTASINCALGREFRAAAKATGTHYSFK